MECEGTAPASLSWSTAGRFIRACPSSVTSMSALVTQVRSLRLPNHTFVCTTCFSCVRILYSPPVFLESTWQYYMEGTNLNTNRVIWQVITAFRRLMLPPLSVYESQFYKPPYRIHRRFVMVYTPSFTGCACSKSWPGDQDGFRHYPHFLQENIDVVYLIKI